MDSPALEIGTQPVARLPDKEFHRSRWTRLGRALLVGLLALFLFGLTVRGGSFTDALQVLAHLNPGLFLFALLTYTVTVTLKAWRWQMLLRPIGQPVRFRVTLGTLLVGQMVNGALPARLGEVTRVYLLGRSEGLSKVAVAGSIVVEKVLDMVAMALLAGLLVLSAASPSGVQESGLRTALLAGLALAGVLVLAYQGWRLLSLIEFLGRRLPGPLGSRLVQWSAAGLEGLKSLHSGRLSLVLWLFSIIIWLLASSTNYVAFRALNLPLGPWDALFVLLVLQFGVIFPSTPGKLVVFEALATGALRQLGQSPGVALTYAVLLHICVYGTQFSLGLLALWLGRSWWGSRPLAVTEPTL